MKTKVMFLVVSASLVLTGAIFLSNDVQADSVTAHDLDKLAKMNIKFEEEKASASFLEVKRVDEKVAIENAKKKFDIGGSPKNVKVEYHLVSNPNLTALPAEVITKHPEYATQGVSKLPAYVVSFEGLDIPNHAPQGINPPHNTELNVLVDAETGDVLNAFTYR